MITQQAASYLIKRMTDIVENLGNSSDNETDALFRRYLKEKDYRIPPHAITNNSINDMAIVEAFKWRAAAQVSNCR